MKVPQASSHSMPITNPPFILTHQFIHYHLAINAQSHSAKMAPLTLITTKLAPLDHSTL